MRYLLDTNVISEGTKPAPDPGVAAWLQGQPPLDLAISVLTFGEVWKGAVLLPAGQRRTVLESWVSQVLPRQFLGRVFPVDGQVALEWGRLAAEGRTAGRELPVIDGLLLATAAVHGLTLVTRNERDCAGRGVPVFNPWSSR
ncbi:MAG TPA: type II toxin-antitoxin system VapC family toxin [Longimicrobiaceae bacterium]|nr:type II toxin-antitoxin system VapC family toxin [Longimicrobiaceae bacterium]